MISVMKLILLVLGLAVSSHPAGCQFSSNYDLASDDLNQLEGDKLALAGSGGPYQEEEEEGAPESYSSLERQVDDELIGELAGELLAARHGQFEPGAGLQSEPEQQQQPLQTGESLPEGVSALIDQLSNQKRETPANYYYYDVNSHLPATSLGGGNGDANDANEDPRRAISGPVNDPEEFEAKLGQLTDTLNHNMANTKDRQELLLSLLNRSTDELEGRLQAPINSLNSISQLEMNRLVGELDKLLDERTNGQREQRQQPEQRGGDSNDGYEFASLSRYGGSEYIDHPLALAGHQYVQGGAGEGRQLLGPDGTYENVQVIKTDSAIPSYCDPPNPCPIGYTAKDGCLEDFVNSASFSREYQAQQKCSCDNEHSLFNCASPMSASSSSSQSAEQDTTPAAAAADDEASSPSSPAPELGGKLDTLARTIQNRFGDLASVQRLISKQQQQQQRQGSNGQNPLLSGNDDADSNYLVRSARKLSSLDMHHKVDLD